MGPPQLLNIKRKKESPVVQTLAQEVEKNKSVLFIPNMEINTNQRTNQCCKDICGLYV